MILQFELKSRSTNPVETNIKQHRKIKIEIKSKSILKVVLDSKFKFMLKITQRPISENVSKGNTKKHIKGNIENHIKRNIEIHVNI